MDELLSEFLTESTENLATLDVEIVRLEQTPDDPELLGSIFRLVHTIKGTCGFLGLPRLEAVAHASENVLGKFRDGELTVTPEAVSLVLASIDRIKDLLSALESTEAEPEGDDNDLIAQLNACASGALAAPTGEAAADEPANDPEADIDAGDDAPADDTLLTRLGGVAVVEDGVARFYEAIAHDDALAPFFENGDAAAIQRIQVKFIEDALGDGDAHTVQCLAQAHAQLIGAGLNDEQIGAVVDHIRVVVDGLGVPGDTTDEVMGLIATVRGAETPSVAPETPAQDDSTPAAIADEAVDQAPEAAPEASTGADAQRGAAAPAQGAGAEPSVATQSVRVNVGQLENLMTTVSELVLTRNQLLQMVRGQEDSEFKAPLQRLSHITTDLQEGVMKTRMQPIGNAWAKLPRIVRSLAHDLDKRIELDMRGADTELDRQVLELIKDPLTHMVRNSGDHGLESPAERLAAGKPETGRIILNAFHEGGHIIIEVSDDGRGIDVEKVKAKILENGLASESEIAAMSDQQVQQFVFHAGFSTAKEVTSVSGRGVGMDVVRSNIEQIGGTVSLQSSAGKGSSFTIKIPLTLAIVSGLIVEAKGERFAIPQISVLELVRAKSDSDHKIELINGTPVLRLRDRLLPLASLSDLLSLSDHVDIAAISADQDSEAFIVVSQVGEYTFGIIVDRVFDTEEIVVKPVSPILRNISLFSGNTILGDGSVIMILDPNGIAAATGQQQFGTSAVDAAGKSGAQQTENAAMLVFRAGNEAPKAVPLSLVARLEEIAAEEIEQADGRPVVQYRGQLMPLVPVDAAQTIRETGRQPVVVFTDDDRSMGLAVDEIVDIVDERVELQASATREGFLGSAVIAGKSTDLIDVGYFLSRSRDDWFCSTSAADVGKRLLLIDDSPFFRNLLAPVLRAAGYDVTTANDADSALALREEGQGFDIIVSDIEMPGMSGFDFAEACRADARWQDTPLVALSSHAENNYLERGRQVGFADYVAKFDRDGLIATLDQTLHLTHSEAA